MKNYSFVVDHKLSIIWMDLGELVSDIQLGNTLSTFFDSGKGFIEFTRWAMSGDKKYFQFETFHNKKRVHVECFQSDRVIHLNCVESEVEGQKGDVYDSEDFWNVFSQTFPGGIVFLNSNLDIVELSQNVVNIFMPKNKDGISFSKRAIIKQNIKFIFSDNQLYDVFSEKLEIVKESREVLSYEAEINSLPVRVMLGPVFKGRKFMGLCIYFIDIKEEIAKNKIIQDQEEMLVQASKLAALAEMAGGIAHEINNPVAIINAKAFLMHKMILKNKYDESFFLSELDGIKDTVKRISKIVIGMRAISTEDSTDESVTIFTLKELIDDLYGIGNEKLKFRNFSLTNHCEGRENEIKCSGKKIQLAQVLFNLLSNSIDEVKGKKDARVELDINLEEGRLKFMVTDNGGGIPEENVSKIFQPFFSTKLVGEGTGLGLSISSRIVKNHGGELVYKREEDQTKFSFEISVLENN